MDRSDDKNTCLSTTTGIAPDTTDDLETVWLRSHVGGPPAQVEDLWLRYFWLNGAVSLSYNDAAKEYLESTLGHAGEIDDLWAEFWSACPISLGPLQAATPEPENINAALDRQSLEHLADMERRSLAQENLIASQHKIYDQAGIPRGGSLESRHEAYIKKGFAPGLRIERIKVSESEYQPPEETSSVTVGEYSALATGFRESIRNMIWSCEGGTITSQPNFNRVIVETDAAKDCTFTLSVHATSERHEAFGKARFAHRHTQLQAPVVSIEQVEAVENGYRPPNKKSHAQGVYKAKTEFFRKQVKRFEWAVDGAEIIDGQYSDTVTIETEGAGQKKITIHLVAEEIYGTADFIHEHPKLESFATLKKRHKAA